jgi:hypothetical protein
MRVEPHARERQAEELADIRFVVDYQDLGLGTHLEP